MNYRFGPLLDEFGVTFRLWAPSRDGVDLLIDGRPPQQMQRIEDGFWSCRADAVGAGARYRFRSGDLEFPDPASRAQADDAGGWTLVVAPCGRPPHAGPLHPWHQSILCEVHVGTATPEGTFAGLAARLEHFRHAGYTTLELMPLNEFPGNRNWGYDGTLIFAPEYAYGSPADLRALVDRAHELDICLVIDVVYNHFGAVDNFLPGYAPEFFDESIKTPWGAALNFREPMVRQFYYENVVHWLAEYDFDGVRFDAVHEIGTERRDQFLGELARAAHAAKPGAKLIIENVENNAHWLTRDAENNPVDYSAQWSDDFHHVFNFLLTREAKDGYQDESRDPIADFEKSLADGFIHDGDAGGDSDGRTRHEPGSQLPMEAFVAFLQNHDQIGNRPDGKRLVDRVDAGRLDFGHFVLLLNPQIPLFFMGEEAHLRCGFTFFFDLPEEAAGPLREGRYEQMKSMFNETVEPGALPDPNDEQTFIHGKLAWDDYALPQHRAALDRFRELTALRRQLIYPLTETICLDARSARQGNGILVTWVYEAGTLNMVLNPTGDSVDIDFESTDELIGTGRWTRDGQTVHFSPWTALVWRS